MFTLLVKHELRNVLIGPRFVIVFSISAVLLILSTLVGINEYHRGVARYDAQQRLLDERIRSAENWYNVRNVAYRKPEPLSVFVSGVSFDVGQEAGVGFGGGGDAMRSIYSSDPLFAFFRFLDFSFVFQIVVSLLAILFTYDRISGERASGTLRMVMSHPIPRVKVVAAKTLGAWIGLLIPLALVVCLCTLIGIWSGIPFSTGDLIRLAAIIATSVVYFSCFVAIGMLVSTLTRDPSTSFLVLLVIWVGFGLIVPRIATEVAGQWVHPMTSAEVQGRQIRFMMDRNKGDRVRYEKIGKEWQAATAGMTSAEQRAYSERTQKEWNDRYTAVMDETREAMSENLARLTEMRRAAVRSRQRLALALSRLSPMGSYRIATMRLAGTGLQSKDAFDDAAGEYSTSYQRFLSERQHVSTGRTKPPRPDPAEMPRFNPPPVATRDALASAAPDVGLLMLYTVLALAGAFVAFLRYDVR